MEYTLVSAADFHQASDCLPIDAQGRQCVPTCIIFLVYNQYFRMVHDITKDDLHEILLLGSHFYCAIAHLSDTLCQFLDPSKLPNRLKFKGKSFGIRHTYVWSGLIETRHGSLDEEFTLETALNFAKDRNIIMVFSNVAIGIVRSDNDYYIFDSHSRCNDGLGCAVGTCVLGCVGSLHGLVLFLRRLVSSVDSTCPFSIQFDVHAFAFTTSHFPKSVVVEILDDNLGYRLTQNRKEIYASVKRKTKRQLTNSESKRKKIQALLQGKDNIVTFIDDRYAGSQFSDECSSLMNNPVSYVCTVFKKMVSSGPDFVCACCCQTFFQHSVSDTTRMKDSNSFKNFLQSYQNESGEVWICKTCLRSVRQGNVPKMWANNGLSFPNRPKALELSNLEERLVSPRLAFMQLREMPRGGQVSVKGNIVNVPADVTNTIKSLPRMVNDCETIMLKLKRRLTYKHHIAFENIRPNIVFEAAKWLVSNSSLFRNEGIVVNDTWLETFSLDSSIHVDDDLEDVNTGDESRNMSTSWTENDNFTERPTGNTDTFLQAADFREFNQILCVAPAENNTPISLFQDLHSEVMAFPSIFCGQKRTQNSERLVPLHYSDICKWELRNVDRRVAICVPNLFYKLKRLQIKQIRDKVTLAVRKCKTNGQKYTAGDILSPGFVDKLTMQDDGYRVLRNIRGSPPYWEQAKRDAFALIRQLGTPTWFCSFSAAETKWEALLSSLSKLVNGKILSAEEIKLLNWQDKCTLIKSDPVTCARYFDFRVQCFINHVLKNSSHPVGEILDYFYRVEFQQRGSPHIHMLIWVKNAPIHGIALDSDVTAFVDKYITCKNDESIPVLVNYQTHRHAKTCRKMGKTVCRFNFPLAPMPKTVILHPLDESCAHTQLQEKFKKISAALDELRKTDVCLTFTDFLANLNMTEDEYLLALRSVLKRATVFLKRDVSESRINNYNKTLICSWEANMDIQYILDPYSCVSYIVSYISKGQRGLSNLLLEACNEAREKDSTVKEQVRRIGNQFLSSVEIGAQEAAYLVLQMPLRRSTRQVTFVDTNRPNDRTSLIKSFSQLKDLPPSSKEIEMDNMLKRYIRRPRVMDQICYAEFVSWYDLCNVKKTVVTSGEATDEDELPENEYEEDKTDEVEMEENNLLLHPIIKFPCGTTVKRRTTQKVLYWHHVPLNKDPEEHYRQQIMLFTAWRFEDKDIKGAYDSYQLCFEGKLEEITRNKVQYEHMDADFFDELMRDLEGNTNETNVENEHREAIDVMEGDSPCKNFTCFDPGSVENNEHHYDLGEDLGIARQNVASVVDMPTGNDAEFYAYRNTVQDLNNEQKTFFYHILHAVKTDPEPFHIFLSGGAGVGKSVLIRTLRQALGRYLNHLRDKDPSSLKVLLCAPTGKAAHNIGGNTLHSAFCIPVSQGFHFKPLDMQQLNTLRARYRDLRILVIDEISMVGRNMMNFISLRLQEIMGCVKPFGGISILAVGDLFQLKPVMDAWIFSTSVQSATMSSLAANVWIDLFMFFELTEIMRQKDDKDFATLLNRLREGEHTVEDIDILKSRCTEPDYLSTAPHIFCRKVDAIDHNVSVLSTLPQSDVITVEAVDCISGDLNAAMHEKVLAKVSTDASKTMGLGKVLVLGIGVPCDICLNIDVNDGLTNGASCVVKYFDFRVPSSDRCSIVWVEFQDSTIGHKWRRKYKNLQTSAIDPSWVPILETTRKFSVKHYKTYLVVRRQFPLVVAAGKTIHKAQGSTMKSCVMHFGNRAVPHLHYVGLSRVTSLSGIDIIKFNEDKITTSTDVHAEMERLRNDRILHLNLPTLNIWNNEMIICFQNCRSLHQHIDDIRHEQNMLNAQLIAFVETRVHEPSLYTSKYHIDGYFAYSSTKSSSAHGIAIYSRSELNHFSVHTFSNIECAVVQTETNIVVCFLYCPPAQAVIMNYAAFMRNLIEILPNVGTYFLIGDFNVDFAESIPVAILLNQSYNLKQLIQSVTTDYGSCLDHIYLPCSDEDTLASGTLESYYSDHKPVYIVRKK